MTVEPDWVGQISTLLHGQQLDPAAASAALKVVLEGRASEAQLAGWLVALRCSPPSSAVVAAMTETMLDAAAPLPLDAPEATIDIVGVGGSPTRRVAALNVSTGASFVAAAAGATVCKHGNRRASSTSGSTDVLDELGVVTELDGDGVARCVADLGLGFAFARTFHPAMRHAAPVRAQLGIPTIFNLLGPLSHPGRVTRQVVGVSTDEHAELVAGVACERRAPRCLVVRGDGGLDELSISGPSRVLDVNDGRVDCYDIDPRDLGLTVVAVNDMPGGDAATNADVLRDTFAGRGGPARDIIALNAAAGLVVAGISPDIAHGLERSFAALDDGSAADLLDRLVRLSRTLAPSG